MEFFYFEINDGAQLTIMIWVGKFLPNDTPHYLDIRVTLNIENLRISISYHNWEYFFAKIGVNCGNFDADF